MPRVNLPALAVALMLAATVPLAGADELAKATQLLRAGQHQQALAQVEKLLAARPSDPKARFLKGLIHTDQGDLRAAVEVFSKLSEDHPELPEPFNNLAVIYAAQGQYDKARVALERSIRTHPSYATAYENLGDVYARLASQAYDKALQLDSANAGAQNKLALVRDLVGVAPREIKVEAIAAARPEPAIASAPARPVPTSDSVLEAVAAWADAWSRKDVDGYLAAYAPDFRTPGGQPRDHWEKVRRERLTAPKTIAVTVDAPRVSFQSETRASVTFVQHYRSDRLSSTAMKTLHLGQSPDGRWRILQEQVSN